jgi:hypothetical protein
MGVTPRRSQVLVASPDPAETARRLEQSAAELAGFVEQLPTHQAFIDRHCRADAPLRAGAA